MSRLQEVTQEQFEDRVLKAALPVMVEFGAEWCGPCKRLEPELEQLAAQWNGRMTLLHVNVDEAEDLMISFGIMSVPTTLLFKGGKEIERLTGYQPRARLIEKFGGHIA